MSALRPIFLVLFLLIGGVTASAEVEVPKITRAVTDLTGSLSTQQLNELEGTLRSFSSTRGSQIAVLIVPTTEPEAIEQFSIRVVDEWKLGRMGIDDGVLLLVALNDRTMRIEVGKGLEGILPDAKAKRIIDDVIIPEFKAGNIYAGVYNGVAAIAKIVLQEELPPPTAASQSTKNSSLVHTILNFLPVLFIGVNFLGIAARKAFGPLIAASLFGAIALFVTLFLGPLFLAIMVGIIVFLVVFSAGSGGSGRSGYGGIGRGYSSGYSGRSMGSFGGGGGGFSGGGASGRW